MNSAQLLQVKKGRGLDDLIRGYTIGKLDESKKVSVTGSGLLIHLLQTYQKFLNNNNLPCLHTSLMAETYSIEKMIDYFKYDVKGTVLKPPEISAFLQMTITYEDHGWYRGLTGIFVSVLMQQSYDAGYNQFYFNIENFPKLDNLAVLVRGKEKKPIEVAISGNIGEHFGHGAAYASLQASSKSNLCFVGCRTQNSTLILRGNVQDLGFYSNDSNFIVYGDVKKERFGPLLYHAQRSSCLIDGSLEEIRKTTADNCTFKTPNKKTYDLLKKSVPPGNRIILEKQ